MEYFAPATIALTVLLLLSLVYRPTLYLTIPMALAASLYAYSAINLVLGFPTRDLRALEQPFLYMGHWSENPVFLLAVPSGAFQPRLYALDSLSSESGEWLAESEKRVGEGEVTRGIFNEGEFGQHNIDPVTSIGPK